MDLDEDSITCADAGKRPHGVYLLFRRKELVYVGRSNNPKFRIDVHRRNGRPFDFAVHVECSAEDARWVEQALIRALEPPQNRMGNPNPAGEVDPPQVIERVIYREREPIKPQERGAVSVSRACERLAYGYGLSRSLRAAIKAGEVASFPVNPDHPNGKRMVYTQEVIDWCERFKTA